MQTFPIPKKASRLIIGMLILYLFHSSPLSFLVLLAFATGLTLSVLFAEITHLMAIGAIALLIVLSSTSIGPLLTVGLLGLVVGTVLLTESFAPQN